MAKSKVTFAGSLLHFVGPCHMGKNHEGLALSAQEKGLDLTKLKRGEYVLFCPAHRKRIKIYGCARAFVDKDLDKKLENAIADGKIDIGLRKGALHFHPSHKVKAMAFCQELEEIYHEQQEARRRALEKRK